MCPVTGEETGMWIYGGSGMIVSRGLMEAVSDDRWREAEARARGGGAGDGIISVREAFAQRAPC